MTAPASASGCRPAESPACGGESPAGTPLSGGALECRHWPAESPTGMAALFAHCCRWPCPAESRRRATGRCRQRPAVERCPAAHHGRLRPGKPGPAGAPLLNFSFTIRFRLRWRFLRCNRCKAAAAASAARSLSPTADGWGRPGAPKNSCSWIRIISRASSASSTSCDQLPMASSLPAQSLPAPPKADVASSLLSSLFTAGASSLRRNIVPKGHDGGSGLDSKTATI